MNRILACLIMLCLFFGLTLGATAAPKKKAKKIITKQKIEFTTKDKHILVGDLYVAYPSTQKPLVVLIHSFGLSASIWSDFAEKLRLKGYNVLAMDLRGHSRSVYNEKLKTKSRFKFKNEDWQKLPKDVVESVDYVKKHYSVINSNDLILVGADIGASAATIASLSFKNPPLKLALISPMLEFKSLRMPVRTNAFYNTKIMMILTKTDRVLINFETKTPAIIKQYPVGGPGNQLLKVNKTAYDDLINFIQN